MLQLQASHRGGTEWVRWQEDHFQPAGRSEMRHNGTMSLRGLLQTVTLTLWR